MTQETKVTLKPCPFCGGEGDLIGTLHQPSEYWLVACKKCDCEIDTNTTDKAEAITAWNTRVEQSVPNSVVEAIAAIKGLLDRDQRNTCLHEETHRGGLLWEICDTCGAKWADDQGGKPEWAEPPEWQAGYGAIAALKQSGQTEAELWKPLQPVLEDIVNDWCAHVQEGGRGQMPPDVEAANAILHRIIATQGETQ